MTGLLINGELVPVRGLEVLPPASHGGPAFARLEARDYRTRRPNVQTSDPDDLVWIRQIIIHTTLGVWPHGDPLPGAGRGGRDKQIADYWHSTTEGKASSGGAHLVVDNDGSVACLCDLVCVEAYHATVSNPWSIGIEMYQESAPNRGRLYEAVLASTVRLVVALCERFEIPLQIPSAYAGAPRQRLLNGGPDVVGVIGHRDNTTQRGRGDPVTRSFGGSRSPAPSGSTWTHARTSPRGGGASSGSTNSARSSSWTGSRARGRSRRCAGAGSRAGERSTRADRALTAR